ncbi:MAG: phosphoribosylaminoimidazolesuccinocarboxamide synthase [Oscillospiraceae bacterium]|jgi:phosphoribosylaminoimidazole-succinocarboxamide synthase|nr:phosphoribosylaminoimidazolesuccinocarboxamide synthase [Oscillospiraceae bacterium]
MKKIISGKVRDVYEVSDKSLVIVTTDRLSAFDVILPTPISGKGVVLNKLSLFWFDYTRDLVPNHVISAEPADLPSLFRAAEFDGRTVLVKKLKMLPYEFVIRGYMFGSMWDTYKTEKSFCGYTFDREYKQAEKLDTPILTPSAKNSEGHDENISVARLQSELGAELTEKIRAVAVALYNRCYDYALQRGIIIADTKFELGFDEDGALVLADEIFTPDSSRFWDAGEYTIGASPKSYDKQFVRDWLTANGQKGVTPAPEIPAEVARKTSEIYADCLKKITEVI